MEYNDLTEEQKAKADACKTPQELVALAAEEGVELTDEQVEAISGGSKWYEPAPGSPDDFRPIPGRPGTPLRIGGYLGRDAKDACAADPAFLAGQFRRVGFADFDDALLARCAEFMALAPGVDFQFDIMEDGTLGDTFGLSLSFNETKPRQARACMQDGYGARICELMQGWGLADDRWRQIAGAAFARHVAFEREDGGEGRFALCVLFNYAKVKFTACEPRPAKFYLILQAGELEC